MKCSRCDKALRFYCEYCNKHFDNSEKASVHTHVCKPVFHNSNCEKTENSDLIFKYDRRKKMNETGKHYKFIFFCMQLDEWLESF